MNESTCAKCFLIHHLSLEIEQIMDMDQVVQGHSLHFKTGAQHAYICGGYGPWPEIKPRKNCFSFDIQNLKFKLLGTSNYDRNYPLIVTTTKFLYLYGGSY